MGSCFPSAPGASRFGSVSCGSVSSDLAVGSHAIFAPVPPKLPSPCSALTVKTSAWLEAQTPAHLGGAVKGVQGRALLDSEAEKPDPSPSSARNEQCCFG